MDSIQKTKYSLRRDGPIFKLLKHLGHIVKEPLKLEMGGHVEAYSPPVKVFISSKFFRSAKCKACGKCCSGISRAFLPGEINERIRIEKGICNQLFMTINGQVAPPFWAYFNHGEKCDFLINSLCSIHNMKPIHCALPMMEIDRTGDHSRLIKRPHGRNWRFGCPAEFKKFDYNEFLNWDFVNLKRLQLVAEYLSISTWLPEIIDYLEKNKEIFKTSIPDEQIVIYEK